MKAKFKLGDIVKIVDAGLQYSGFTSMSRTMELKYWNIDNPQKQGFVGMVISIEEYSCFDYTPYIYGIRNIEKRTDVIIGERGIELANKSVKTLLDSELFVI